MPQYTFKMLTDSYVILGKSPEATRALVFSASTFEDFLKTSETLDFAEHPVRVATGHTRLDVALLSYQGAEIHGTLKLIRQSLTRLTYLAAAAVVMLIVRAVF